MATVSGDGALPSTQGHHATKSRLARAESGQVWPLKESLKGLGAALGLA